VGNRAGSSPAFDTIWLSVAPCNHCVRSSVDRALASGARSRGFETLRTRHACGCSSMVELQPSKLVAWVRFPSPAPFHEPLAQLAEHLTFNQGVGGSSPPWLTSAGVAELADAHDSKSCGKPCRFESGLRHQHLGGIAQLGEHLPCKQGVVGSNPSTSTIGQG
jgi:hypothetical protein